MSDSSPLLVAVFGATGQQGGAVCRALLANAKGSGSHSQRAFRVRAITRDPKSEAAQKLLANHPSGHVEVVSADFNDNESLQKALVGVWGVFLVTQWRVTAGTPSEEQQAKTVADYALKAGAKFFVYSSLPNAETLSGGRHHVHHFTAKNHAEQYIRSLPFSVGVAFAYPGMYASNFLTLARPKKNEKDGVYEFVNIVRHDVALPIVDIEEEYGSLVLEIFGHPEQYKGQSIFTGTYLTLPQLAEAFTKATGKPARYIQLPQEAGKSFGEEVFDMFQYWNNIGFYGGAGIPHIPNVKKTDAVAFFQKHASQFP